MDRRGKGKRGGFGPCPSRGRSERGRGGFTGNGPRSQSNYQPGRAEGSSSRHQSFSRLHTTDNQENRQRHENSASRRPHGTNDRVSLRDRFDRNAVTGHEKQRGFIGFQKLTSWAAETNPGQLVISIASESDSLSELLQGNNIKPDWYSLLIEIGRFILSGSHQIQALKKVLTVLITSHFFGQYLLNFVTEKRRRTWPVAKEFYETVVAIITEITALCPDHASRCQMPLLLLPSMVQDTREVSEAEKQDIIQAIKDLQEKIKKIEEENKGGSQFRRKVLRYSDTDTPPEDFRQLSVIPEASDLTQEAEPFVRAALAKGAYTDEAHYLDVQFRLMREDFIRPLREGIIEFRNNGCRKDYRSSDLRLYFDVYIIGMTTVNGIHHVLRFDNKSMKSVKWEHSKRLLNGSLICLSNDDFETIFIATVAFRTPDDLKDGIITVEFKTGLEAVFCCSSAETFVMVETTSYFEAYSPILEGLKELTSSVSLQRYFIFCHEKLKPPEYLLGGIRKFDLSSLTKDGDTSLVPILNTMSWPRVEKMNLNESQREAVQLALTKELAVIQGPPGTGKTYVGLKVMKVLLENKNNMVGNEKGESDPILVLCYTNHALDQFLEGVFEFCPKGIVRVGGRSSSTKMESLNLRALKKNQTLSAALKRAFWNIKQTLKASSEEIERLKLKIDNLYIGVMEGLVLHQFMSSQHYDILMAKSKDGFSGARDSPMKSWLNASKRFDRSSLPQLIRSHLMKLVLQVSKVSYIDTTVNPTHLKSSIQRMSVVERACLYQGWLHNFLSQLDQNMYLTCIIEQDTRRRILSLPEIQHVIPPAVCKCIYSLLSEPDIEPIENWLLGLHKSLSDQLNDVEHLMLFFGPNDDSSDGECEDVDAAVQTQKARQIDVDHGEEAAIAKATMKIKDGDAFLLIKAEKLGLGSTSDDQREEEDEWQMVTYKKPLSFSKLRFYLTTIEPMTEEEEKDVSDLWSLDMKKRFALYNLWIKRCRSNIAEKMEDLVKKYKDTLKEKKEMQMESDIDILKQARVIGMTTTGAAKCRAMLQVVACRIIVVEEAAEVLEAHIITSINRNCKHLLLIGDHQQLKPHPTVYALAKDYNLELSLFERLIKNGIHHVSLKEQHRMRESISKIMRHIYPDLQDNISVTKYDNVRGMEKNIFFIDHEKLESDVSDAKSKSNTHESSYLVALLGYLLLQGYNPTQITILATYVGQIFMLRKELKAKQIGEGVRITTVDNYQGEENDIVLLSLVRSNAKSVVGFLKVENRVCVALSRAKKGFYAIGNFKMLASKSELWKKIVETATIDDIIGDGLPVTCPNHESFRLEICAPDDFERKCPQGGCGRMCEFRLKCGHACPLLCHGYDSKHEKVECVKKCAKSCPEGHPCKKRCIQKCGNCTEMVEKIIPLCGHTDKVPCWQPATSAICSQSCLKLLDCQHKCLGKCGECDKNKEHTRCRTPVEYFWPCDHICKVPCYLKPSEFSCPQKCEAVLECGHKCKGTCSECVEGTMHVACSKECPKLLPCGHQCPSLCSIPCPPCPKVCANSCRHSKCGTKDHACGSKCVACQEPCLYRCPHQRCSKKCFEECDIEPCKEKCPKLVKKCQHPCSAPCGEICLCTICTSDNPEQRESSLLIRIPSCGHVINVNELDTHVNSFEASEHLFFLPCPVCKKAIQNTFRYMKIIKRKNSLKEEEKQKIRQANKISEKQKRSLQESRRILENKDLYGTWLTLTNIKIDKLGTGHEMTSLNLKYKYAHILSDLLLFDSRQQSNEYEVKLRITAVQKLEANVTQQQISEFQIELKHFLLGFYIKMIEENVHGNSKSESGNLFQEARDVLKEKEDRQSALEKLCTIVKALETKAEKENSSSTLSLTLTKKTVARDLKILDSKEDEMLCDILAS